MERIVYENKYGRLEIEVVGAYRAVGLIRCRDLDPSLSFTIDQAEQISLITDNRGIQVCFQAPEYQHVFLLHHESSGLAAECRIVNLQFTARVNAQDEIERLAPKTLGPL